MNKNKSGVNNVVQSYSLPVLQIMKKIDMGEDCTNECRIIRMDCNDVEKQEICDRLFEKLSKNIELNLEIQNIVTVIKQIGYIDEIYLNDYIWLMNCDTSTIDSLNTSIEISRIINRDGLYTHTAYKHVFIKRLTDIVAASNNTQMLITLIDKLENNKF